MNPAGANRRPTGPRLVERPPEAPTLGEIGLNQFAPYLMNRIMSQWNGSVADALKPHGMSLTTMRALAVLSVSSSITVNELAAFAVTEQSTMSRALDVMEEQGLVRRRPRPDDARAREVSITDYGREMFTRVWAETHVMFRRMLQGIDEEEYVTFVATLQKVLRNMRTLDG